MQLLADFTRIFRLATEKGENLRSKSDFEEWISPIFFFLEDVSQIGSIFLSYEALIAPLAKGNFFLNWLIGAFKKKSGFYVKRSVKPGA